MASKKAKKSKKAKHIIWTRLVDDDGQRRPAIALLITKNPDWMTIGEMTRLIGRLQTAVMRLERRVEKQLGKDRWNARGRLTMQLWP